MEELNRWQKKYCDEYYKGKIPRSKQGKHDLELLGKVKSQVTVEFPERTSVNGVVIIPARTETLIVTEDDCNIPEGKISVSVLVSNLNLWMARNQKIIFD